LCASKAALGLVAAFPAARAELDLRFARGDIDTEDYSARKKLLDT